METTFEQGFADAERAAEASEKSAARLIAQLKQMKKSAKTGDISALNRSAERIASLLDALRDDIAMARSAWPFSTEEEVDYLGENYAAELRQAALAAGLKMYEIDGRIVCSPSVIRLQAGDRSVRVDRRRITAIRPSVLAAQLKANQAAPARFKANQFLEALYRAYRMLLSAQDQGPRTQAMQIGAGPVVALDKIYQAFTLQPGAAAEYGQADFARDLYLLDVSGVRATAKGQRFSLPASSGTRGGKLFSFVTQDGETINYYGIRFEAEA